MSKLINKNWRSYIWGISFACVNYQFHSYCHHWGRPLETEPGALVATVGRHRRRLALGCREDPDHLPNLKTSTESARSYFPQESWFQCFFFHCCFPKNQVSCNKICRICLKLRWSSAGKTNASKLVFTCGACVLNHWTSYRKGKMNPFHLKHIYHVYMLAYANRNIIRYI